MDADVVVVGGGLAGSACAIDLRARGLSVLVVEKRPAPRPKPCGEGLLPHGVLALRALGLEGALAAVDAQPFRGIRYRCGPVVADGLFEGDGRAWGVRRERFDGVAQQRARDAGATLVVGAAARVDVRDDGVAVTTSSGDVVRGAFLVGADGPRSTVRHALGLDGGAPRAGRYALRRHFRVAPGRALPDFVEVTVVDGWELYLTPVATGVVNVAALCERRVFQAGGGATNARLDALLRGAPREATSVLDGAVPDDDALACGPLRVKARAVHRGRALLVGDAAGYVDALTGEGMSLALRTSRFATAAIDDAMRGRTSVDDAFRRYARARAAAFRDHALLTHGLVFLARRKPLATRAVARLAREPALFTRLLAVNDGRRTFASLGLSDVVKLAVGATPG